MKHILPIVLAAVALGLVALGFFWLGRPAPSVIPATVHVGPLPTAPADEEPTTDPTLPEADPEREASGAPSDPTPADPAPLATGQPVDPVEDPSTDEPLTPIPETLAELRALAAGQPYADRAQRLTERLPQAAADLGLSSDQQAELERLVLTLYEQEHQLDALWEATQDGALMGAKKDGDWGIFQAGLEGLLSPEQLQAYGALDAWAFPGATGRGR